MRNAIVAALVLSPLMVHAQANQPAQLVASLKAPAAMMLGEAGAGDPSTKVTAVRISTGVVAPQLVHSVAVHEDTVSVISPTKREVVVAMIVDEKGVPSDLKVVSPTGTALDQSVLSAVRQFRYKPGTVSGEPVAVPVYLHVTVQQPGL